MKKLIRKSSIIVSCLAVFFVFLFTHKAFASDFSTPEKAFESLTKAMENGDIEGMAACLSLKSKELFLKKFEGMSQSRLEDIKRQIKDRATKSTLTIIEKIIVSNTETHLKVKSEFYSNETKLNKSNEDKTTWQVFKLESGQWRSEINN